MTAGSGDGSFPTTHWTLVARLRSPDEATARRALDDLCGQYRYPLYCAIRHRGLSHHDAEDALHEFLAKLLRLEAFQGADSQKGQLRSYLNVSLARFLANWHRDHASRAREVSIDAESAAEEDEARYQRERFPEHETPERIFDRQWARELLHRVLVRLEHEYARRDKALIFATLAPVLRGGGSLRGEDTAQYASTLGLSASGLRSAHQRLLRDYGDLLEDEVLQTVSTRAEMEQELAHLQAVFHKD